MIDFEVYDHIVVIIISGEMTIDETQQLANTIAILDEKNEDVFMISIPINLTTFPTKVAEMVKASSILQKTQRNVKRLYGIKYNPVFSFISLVAIQLLRLKSNTVEAANLDELYEIIERETELFPTLKSAWEKHGETIKDKLNNYEHQNVA